MPSGLGPVLFRKQAFAKIPSILPRFRFLCFDLAVVVLTDSGTLKGGVSHTEKPEKGNHEVKRNSCLLGGLCVPSWLKGQS